MILDSEHEGTVPIQYGKVGSRKTAGTLFFKAREDIKKQLKKGAGDSLDAISKASDNGVSVEKDGRELLHDKRVHRKEHVRSIGKHMIEPTESLKKM